MKLGLYTLILEGYSNKIIAPEFKFDFGYGNGYVLIPKGHPFYNKNCDDIEFISDYGLNVHGGITFCEYFDSDNFLELIKDREFCGDVNLENYKKFDRYWIIGFDTNHYGDNKNNCSKEYVIKETEYLLDKCLDDSIKDIRKYKYKYLRKKKLLNINNV